MQLTLFKLCRGTSSKVLTCRVLRAIPLPAMLEPVSTPPVVITAAPPAPAKNVEVPVTPTVVKAAPSPAPMTGANRPADKPMTKPPPKNQI